MPRPEWSTRSYASPIDVRITPEPTDAERAAILAALAQPSADDAGDASAWLRAALEDRGGAVDEYGSEPTS